MALVTREASRLLTRGAFGSFVVKVAGAAIALGVHLILARMMGAADYGVYIYVWTWITLGALVGTLGFTASSVRFVAEFRDREDWARLRGFLRVSGWTVTLASLVVSGSIAALAWALLREGSPSLLGNFFIGALTLPLFVRLQVSGGAMRGLERVVHGQWPQYLLHPLMILTFFIGAVTLGGREPSARAALVATLAASALSAAVAAGIFRHFLPKQASRSEPSVDLGPWLWTSLAMVLIAGFNLVLQRTDTLTVGALLGTTEAGLYTVGSKVAGLIGFSPIAVNAAFAPMAARLHSAGQLKELQNIVVFAARLGLGVSLVVLVVLGFSYETVLDWFGAEFLEASTILWILAGGQLIGALTGPAVMVLGMTGHHTSLAKILGFGAGLNLGLNLLLVPQLGEEGGAWATVTSLAVWNLLVVWSCRRNLGIGATAFSRRKGLR